MQLIQIKSSVLTVSFLLEETQKRFKVKNKVIYKKEFFLFCWFTVAIKTSSLSENLFYRVGKTFFL